MFTRMQLSIIKGLSTILFQGCDGDHRKPELERLKYWDRREFEMGHTIGTYTRVEVNDDDGNEVCVLYTRNIMDNYFIVVNVRTYDEYGELEDEREIGHVLVNPERMCWELHYYAAVVENILTPFD